MKQKLKRYLKPLSIIMLLISSLLIESCGEKQQDQKPENKTTYTDTIAVETQPVKLNELVISKNFSGSLEGEDQANIFAKIPERIIKINAKVGSYVNAGDVLIELDKGGAASQFYQTQAAYLNSQKNFERMQNLLKEGAVSQQSFDAAQTQYEVSKANFDAAKNTVEIAAPISGVITSVNVNIGDLANPQMPMAVVANISRMKIKFSVGENDAPSFYIGQPVEIYSEMRPNVIQSGKISQLSESGDVQSRSFEMQAMFANSSDKWFKPGMFGRIKVNLETKKNVLTIPLYALVRANNEEGVYIIKDNKSYYQKVTVGLDDGKYVEITSGLNAGDVIVSLGTENLKNGSVVIVTNKK